MDEITRMKIGVWYDINKTSKSYQRLQGLIKIFNSFEGVQSESFIPFADYSHLIISSDLIEKNLDLILKQKTKKVFIDGFDEKHKHFFDKQYFFEYSVDYYKPTQNKSFQFETCLWLGFKQDLKFLKSKFLKNKKVYVMSDSMEEIKKLSFEISVDFKADYIFATNTKALFEAWVRKIPVFALDLPEIKKEYENIYKKTNVREMYKDLFRPIKENELNDFLELYKTSPNIHYFLSNITRDYVLKHHLNYNRAIEWMEVLND